MAVRLRYDNPVSQKKLHKYLKEKHNIDINIKDVVTLTRKYANSDNIIKNAEKYTYDNKLIDWYVKRTKKFENTDRFRQAAIHFNKYGVYTKATKSNNISSPYVQFWIKESQRCVHGYHVGDDWITGYHYWYLNYCRIEINRRDDVEALKGSRFESFPDFWDGDYFAFHYIEEAQRLGLHCNILKARGVGFSWKLASILDHPYFFIPGGKSMVYASHIDFINSEDGILEPKAWNVMNFIDQHTVWTKKRVTSKSTIKKSGFLGRLPDGSETESGWGSVVAGATVGSNIHKARGGRYQIIAYEEFGSFSKGKSVWDISTPSVEQGEGSERIVFGTKIAFGTGGEVGEGFEAIKDITLKPHLFNVLSIPNIFEDGALNQRISFFWAANINNAGYMDSEGNSDFDTAKNEILKSRQKDADNGATPDILARRRAERPLTVKEAMLSTEGSIFPIIDIDERILELESSSATRSLGMPVTMVINNEGVVSVRADVEGKLEPILDFQQGEEPREGCVIIYYKPSRINGEVLQGRYIGGCDPIEWGAKEVGKKYSYGATYIMDTLTQEIVAAYIGRPVSEDTFYENTRRLAIYYGAEIMYENNLKGLERHFKSYGSYHYLANEPTKLKNTIISESRSSRPKGFTATAGMKAHGLKRLAAWVIRKAEDVDIPNLGRIPDLRLLKELYAWTSDTNCDAVSAMVAAIIGMEELDTDEIINETHDSSLYAKALAGLI